MIKSLYQSVDEISKNHADSLDRTLILFIPSDEIFNVSEYIPKNSQRINKLTEIIC
jgi:hypothetical protein